MKGSVPASLASKASAAAKSMSASDLNNAINSVASAQGKTIPGSVNSLSSPTITTSGDGSGGSGSSNSIVGIAVGASVGGAVALAIIVGAYFVFGPKARADVKGDVDGGIATGEIELDHMDSTDAVPVLVHSNAAFDPGTSTAIQGVIELDGKGQVTADPSDFSADELINDDIKSLTMDIDSMDRHMDALAGNEEALSRNNAENADAINILMDDDDDGQYTLEV